MEEIIKEVNDFIEEQGQHDDRRVPEVLKVLFNQVLITMDEGYVPNLAKRTLDEALKKIRGEV
tara:strand:+ start:163 stop:351 length:189 start_codon:yes stop_codon:yes gene_type:complete